MTTFTLQQIADFVRSTNDTTFDIDDDTINEIRMCASSMTTKMQSYMQRMKLFSYDDVNDAINIDIEHIDVIRSIANIIHFEYDNDAHDVSLWALFDLSGDDDVDYNASYFEMLCDVVEQMIAPPP